MELIDLSKIYSPKTREYIQEVLSSFENGNYRSSIVMLYSVCLCDLYFKLIELRDVYSDQYSKDLLHRIEQKIATDKASPAWEAEIVDSLFKSSPILDTQSYALVCHLRDFRNLSAHPVLDDYSELFMPSKEIVEAYIKSAFETVLSKPALLVSNAVEVISEDLDEKKGYLLDDRDGFRKYVTNKYLNRMPEAMIKRVFKSFWKFAFVLMNEKCNDNRLINVYFLSAIYKFNKIAVETEIKAEADKYEIVENDATILMAFWLCCTEESIFSLLPDVTKALLLKYTHQNQFYRLISWFTSENKKAHVDSLIASKFDYLPTKENHLKFLFDAFKASGDLQCLYRYFISSVGTASSFKEAEKRIETYVIPYLHEMSNNNIEMLIACFNENRQVYNNYRLSYFCERVWEYARAFLLEVEVKEKYPRFIIPECE